MVTQKGDRLVGVCRLLGDGGVGGGVGGGHIDLHPLVPAHARTVEDSMVCRGRGARHRNNIGYIWPARSRTHELQQYKLKYFTLILILPNYQTKLIYLLWTSWRDHSGNPRLVSEHCRKNPRLLLLTLLTIVALSSDGYHSHCTRSWRLRGTSWCLRTSTRSVLGYISRYGSLLVTL